MGFLARRRRKILGSNFGFLTIFQILTFYLSTRTPPWGGGVSGENYGLKVLPGKKYGLKPYDYIHIRIRLASGSILAFDTE